MAEVAKAVRANEVAILLATGGANVSEPFFEIAKDSAKVERFSGTR